ncbi:MAG: hypothetical protein AAFQ41_09735 [Cyanobacteria bacterium J06623_7]
MSTSPGDNYYVDKVDDPLARAGANSLVGLGTGLIGKLHNYFQDKQQAAKAAEAYAQKYCDRKSKIENTVNITTINLSPKILVK